MLLFLVCTELFERELEDAGEGRGVLLLLPPLPPQPRLQAPPLGHKDPHQPSTRQKVVQKLAKQRVNAVVIV